MLFDELVLKRRERIDYLSATFTEVSLSGEELAMHG